MAAVEPTFEVCSWVDGLVAAAHEPGPETTALLGSYRRGMVMSIR